MQVTRKPRRTLNPPRGQARAAVIVPLICATMGLNSAASAATLPIYTATARTTGNASPNVGGDATVVNSASATYQDGRVANAQSVAGPDGIGFGSSAGVPPRDPADAIGGVLPFASVSASSGGAYYVDDLIFTSTGNGQAQQDGFAEVSALFMLDGVISLNQMSGANSNAIVTIGVSFGLGEPGTGVVADTVGTISRERDRSQLIVRNEGVFSGLGDDATMSIAGTYALETQIVPLDTTLIFTMGAGGRSAVVSRQDETGVGAFLDFMHTFTLGNGSSVFDLPDGITVNSAQLGIVNNRFAAPSPVPVPPALAMMLSATALLGVIKGRRRKRAV